RVAEVAGPWAVDLHQGGPLMGKGGADEQALPIITLANQSQNGNAPFDPTVRYAFGFDLVPATANAMRLNVDASDSDYADMITHFGRASRTTRPRTSTSSPRWRPRTARATTASRSTRLPASTTPRSSWAHSRSRGAHASAATRHPTPTRRWASTASPSRSTRP